MKQFVHYLVQSVLIYASTHALALVLLTIGTYVFFAMDPPALPIVVAVALIVSLPAIILLIPGLHLLGKIQKVSHRIGYAVGSILLISLIVVLVFAKLLAISSREIPLLALFISPYIISAELSFLVFARVHVHQPEISN